MELQDTRMGQKFFNCDVPKAVKALESIAKSLDKLANNTPEPDVFSHHQLAQQIKSELALANNDKGYWASWQGDAGNECSVCVKKEAERFSVRGHYDNGESNLKLTTDLDVDSLAASLKEVVEAIPK